MSTRATYQFDSEYFGRQTFYIHHDGYLQGAAKYFRKAVNFQENRFADLAAKFFRANDRAEFTSAAEDHADTDFRYEVTGKNLVVRHIEDYPMDDWKVVFEGSLDEFLFMFDRSGEVA